MTGPVIPGKQESSVLWITMLPFFFLCCKHGFFLLSFLSFPSLFQVNDCETEHSLCSAALSHAAPSSQGMAKVQDGHPDACGR